MQSQQYRVLGHSRTKLLALSLREGAMVSGTLANPSSAVTVTLAGKVCSASLGALRRRIDRARRQRGSVVIDLSEVTLIDRPALEFLATMNGAGVELVNCPAYIEPWLRKEA